MKLASAKRLTLEGRGAITLHPSGYIATGGEASVYGHDDFVVKLYTNSGKIRQDDMEGKIAALSAVNHPYIIAPRGMVFDGYTPIGYYMDRVVGEPMARMFNNSTWKRVGFDYGKASVLAAHMLDIVLYANNSGMRMVDPNELNWMAVLTGDLPAPRILDVDSWAFGKWPPRAIMPSIRDWHNPQLTLFTDLFAWGVVTFQLYTGIHPYKGELPGYAMDEMQRRMRDNASVFSTGAQFPRAVRDFNNIPTPLLEWYIATFQHGVREEPPSPLSTTNRRTQHVTVARTAVNTISTLKYQRLTDATSPALKVFPCGIVLRENLTLWDLGAGRKIGSATHSGCEVVQVDGGWLVANPSRHGYAFEYIDKANFHTSAVASPIQGQTLLRYANRLFMVGHGGLNELVFRKFGDNTILTVGSVFGALPNSTEWFDGVGIQDAMGAKMLIAPFGDNACGVVRVPELDSLTVITAKAGHRFVCVIAMDADGRYRQFEFSMSRNYDSYSVRQSSPLNGELNMALAPRGDRGVVGATIVRDGELVIFVPSNGQVNNVADKDVVTTMSLANWDERIVYIHNGEIWRVST